MRLFDELVVEAVDGKLTLGSSAREAAYFHLKDKFKIAKDEIPNHLDDFED
jgi:hypothetical protein